MQYTSKTSFLKAIFIILCVASHTSAQATTDAKPDSNPLLIRGKSIEIRKSDFDLESKNIPPEQRGSLSTNLDLVKKVLERMSMNATLLKAIEAEGFQNKPDVQAEVELAKKQKLISLYALELNNRIVLPDLEPVAKERYRTSQKDLVEPEKVSAYHIIVTTAKRTREQAIARIQEARKRALAGEDFVKLVREYTEDPSARRNDGYLGFFPRGQMDPAFSDAAFALQKQGDLSDVVESQFGFHIIKLQERHPSRVKPYEEMRSQYLEDAARTYREQELRKLMNELMAKEAPEANMPEIEKLLDKDAMEARKNMNEKLRQQILESQKKATKP